MTSRDGRGRATTTTGDAAREQSLGPSVLTRSVNPVQSTPLPLLVEAGWLLVHRFPSISVIHTPTFFQSLRDGHFNQLKVGAMLALCARFIPALVARHGSATEACRIYADFVHAELYAKLSQGPDIEIVQCLLLLGMYEWGESRGFNAWMYVGESNHLMPNLWSRRNLNPPRMETQELIFRIKEWPFVCLKR
jgi:hypothetical protein